MKIALLALAALPIVASSGAVASELALAGVGCEGGPRRGASCAAVAATDFGRGAPREAASEDARLALLLAERVIERSWGPSEDSVYVTRVIPGWRSEGLAIGLSAAVPGLGQAYAGDVRRGFLFAAVEAAGWIVRQAFVSRGDELRRQAERFAGAPTDSAAPWSFARFEGAGDPDTELRALYAADRDAFYDRIATDPRYAGGWGGDTEEQRRHLQALREISDDRLRIARYAGFGLWLNHLTSAVDALRAARHGNLTLGPQLGIRVKSGWRGGGPSLTAVIERRF